MGGQVGFSAKEQTTLVIFRLGAIGDLVNTIPLVKFIRWTRPGDHLIYVVNKKYASLLERVPEIDLLVQLEEDDLKPIALPQTANYLSQQINCEGWQIEFVCLQSLNQLIPLASLMGVTRLHEYRNRNYWLSKLTAWQRFIRSFCNVAPLEELKLKMAQQIPLLKASNTEDIRHKLSSRKIDPEAKLIALIPGVGQNYPHKAWPKEHWVELFDMLQQANIQSVFVGGEQDKELISDIIAKSKNPELTHLNLAGLFLLDELVDLFSIVSCAIGADTGPVHIAAAMGKLNICLFGPTSRFKHAPIQGTVLHESCSLLCKLQKNRSCSKAASSCMYKITAKRVFRQIMSEGF